MAWCIVVGSVVTIRVLSLMGLWVSSLDISQ